MSKQLEKYIELKKECEDANVDSPALTQYLHIAQVMTKEEETWRKHRKQMNNWLNNIEKDIKSHIKFVKESEVD